MLFVVILGWVVCVLGVCWMTGGFCVGEGVIVGGGGVGVLWCGGVTGSGDPADPGGGLLVFCVGMRLCVGWQLVHTQCGGGCCLFDIPAHLTVWWVHDLQLGHFSPPCFHLEDLQVMHWELPCVCFLFWGAGFGMLCTVLVGCVEVVGVLGG